MVGVAHRRLRRQELTWGDFWKGLFSPYTRWCAWSCSWRWRPSSGCRSESGSVYGPAGRRSAAPRAVPGGVSGESYFRARSASCLFYSLNPDIWLSFLIVFGTQWYIVFNVIAGAAAFPNDLTEAVANFRIRGWHWWTNVIIPAIFPYYVTGALTASGGSWNASIVAEYVKWKDHTVSRKGIGAYIAKATEEGDYPKIVLGVAVMSIFVILFNRLFWRPALCLAERRLRL